MLTMLLVCALCAGKSVEAFSLKQKGLMDSEGVLSGSSVLRPLAALSKSKLSERRTSQSMTEATAAPTAARIPSAAPTAVPTAVTTGLSGYIILQLSGDSSCTWEAATSQQLNYCTMESDGEYTRLTATSTAEVTQTTYTDSKCATKPTSYETITLGTCILGHKFVYSPTKTPESTRPFVQVT